MCVDCAVLVDFNAHVHSLETEMHLLCTHALSSLPSPRAAGLVRYKNANNIMLKVGGCARCVRRGVASTLSRAVGLSMSLRDEVELAAFPSCVVCRPRSPCFCGFRVAAVTVF